MVIPADLFTATGESLFGRTWKSELAERLNVNERQIRRWANGEYDPSPGVWADLAVMIADRRAGLSRLALAVNNAAKA